MRSDTTRELEAIKVRLKRPDFHWKHPREHYRLLHRAAELGDAEAYEDLGGFYRDGKRYTRKSYFNENHRLAKHYFRLAAIAGRIYGMQGLADELSRPYLSKKPPTSKRDLVEAIAWYRKAGKKDSSSFYNLGITFLFIRRFADAYRAFKRSAKRGGADSLYQLALAELNGVGTPRNVGAAIARLEKITKMGNRAYELETIAMIHLGQILREGILVPRDYNQSVKWLRLAEKKGSKVAKAILEEEWL